LFDRAVRALVRWERTEDKKARVALADEAQLLLEEVLVADPESSRAHCNLGIILEVERRDYSAAASSYRAAIEFEPQNPCFHFNLGHILHVHMGAYNSAATEYRTCIEIDPVSQSEAHNHLGLILDQHVHDYDGAEEQYRAGESCRISKPVPCLTSVSLLPPRVSLGCYLQAIAIDYLDADAHYNLGTLLQCAREDYSGAEAELRKAIGHRPHHSAAHFTLAAVLGWKLVS
jgi:tetratricopeptide (TPR) repeat protein